MADLALGRAAGQSSGSRRLRSHAPEVLLFRVDQKEVRLQAISHPFEMPCTTSLSCTDSPAYRTMPVAPENHIAASGPREETKKHF